MEGLEGVEGRASFRQRLTERVFGKGDIGRLGPTKIRDATVPDMDTESRRGLLPEGFDLPSLAEARPTTTVWITPPRRQLPAIDFHLQMVGRVGEADCMDLLKSLEIVIEPIREDRKRNPATFAPFKQIPSARIEINTSQQRVQDIGRQTESIEEFERVLPGVHLALPIERAEFRPTLRQMGLRDLSAHVLHTECPVEIAEDSQRINGSIREPTLLGRF